MSAQIYAGIPAKDQELYRIGFVNRVIRIVGEALGIDESEMKSSSRKREIVESRHIAIGIILKKNKFITLVKLGKIMGGRDHSTMIHSNETFNDLCDTDKKFKLKVKSIEKLIELPQ